MPSLPPCHLTSDPPTKEDSHAFLSNPVVRCVPSGRLHLGIRKAGGCGSCILYSFHGSDWQCNSDPTVVREANLTQTRIRVWYSRSFSVLTKARAKEVQECSGFVHTAGGHLTLVRAYYNTSCDVVTCRDVGLHHYWYCPGEVPGEKDQTTT